MLTKQNIKSHRPLCLFRVSPGRGPLVPPSLHPSRAKPHHPSPSPSPSPAGPSSSHKLQFAWGGAALGNSTSANYYFLQRGVKVRLLWLSLEEEELRLLCLVSSSTRPVSQPATASHPASPYQEQHSSLRMPERGNAGGSEETAAASAQLEHHNLLASRWIFSADNSTPCSI